MKHFDNDSLTFFLSRLQIEPPREDPSSPKVSIVMPSFNQRQFIERSILSVLNQNYPNLEFIIIDGGSRDGTVDVIRKYERYLAFWASEADEGQSDALNKGFSRATGEIYGWLNSDDLYLPGAIERVANAFALNPSKRIVHGDSLTIDVDDGLIGLEYSLDFSLNQLKYEGFHLVSQALFWRREVHQRFSGFDIDLYHNMDYQMILEFGINEGVSAFLRLPIVLGAFRRHANQKTLGFNDRALSEHRLMAERYRYLDKYEALGKAKRLVYRIRRACWYVRRGGIRYFLGKLMARWK